MTRLSATVALLAIACGAPPKESADLPAETAPEETGDSDTAPADTGANPERTALYRQLGRAIVQERWDGTESLLLTADDADGDVLCEVTLTLGSTGPRTDCDICAWAFDVEVTAVEGVTDLECAAAGLDSADTLLGTIRGLGYCLDYYGHGPVLMGDDGGAWAAIEYAWWDDSSGELLYTIDNGYLPY